MSLKYIEKKNHIYFLMEDLQFFFLIIIQHYSVHSKRDDHLEETIYHLIQVAVSFIRSNEQRFDPSKLQECYQKRHILKTNSFQ